jgi:hypothetical protein
MKPTGGQPQQPAQAGASGNVVQDLQNTIKSNLVPFIVRCVAWLSSIIVFGCISDSAQLNGGCFYGLNLSNPKGVSSICGFGIFVGVMSWLFEMALIVLLLKDAIPPLKNLKLPAQWPMILLGAAAVWDIFWFANAINLSAGYSTTCSFITGLPTAPACSTAKGQSGSLGAVFFSYVSLGCWSFMTFEFFKQWREGSPKSASPQQKPANTGPKPGTVAQPPLTQEEGTGNAV